MHCNAIGEVCSLQICCIYILLLWLENDDDDVDGGSYGRDGYVMVMVIMEEMVMGMTSVDGLSLQRLTVGWLSHACTGDHRQRSSAHR